MFDVLMFLFENYMENSIALKVDEETVFNELSEIGFHYHEIGRALDWLDGLSRVQACVQFAELTPHANRSYTQEEAAILDVEARGFLLYLERMGILDPITREIVIDRLMALDYREIDMGRIKWVVLLALFNQPSKKTALTLLQDMVLCDAFHVLH